MQISRTTLTFIVLGSFIAGMVAGLAVFYFVMESLSHNPPI